MMDNQLIEQTKINGKKLYGFIPSGNKFEGIMYVS